MAKAVCVQATLVIFSCLLIVQNVHSRARYYRPEPLFKASYTEAKTLQRPLNFEDYQECRHQICSNSNDYPEEEILRVMRNTKNLQGLFGIVLNSTFDTTQVASRSGFSPAKAKKLCSTDTFETFQPRVLRNTDLTWKFVVNVEGYYQRFTAEICRNSKNPFMKRTSNDPCTDFGFECRQSYQEVYLLTFENGIIDFDKFIVPTTCNCVCDL